MMFRKKPVIVEAYWAQTPMDIETPEGTMHANPGDWIITGVNGEQYPCKPDIFAKTYEQLDGSPPPIYSETSGVAGATLHYGPAATDRGLTR